MNVREQLNWLHEEKFGTPCKDDDKSLFVQILARFQTLRKPTQQNQTRRRLFSSSYTDNEDKNDRSFDEFQTPPRVRRQRSSPSPPRLAATSPIDKSRLRQSVVKLMSSAVTNVIGRELHERGLVEVGMNPTSPARSSAADGHTTGHWSKSPYKNVFIGFLGFLCIGLPMLTFLFSSQQHSPGHDGSESNIRIDHAHPPVFNIHDSGSIRSSIDGVEIEGDAQVTSPLDVDDQLVSEPALVDNPSIVEPRSMFIFPNGNTADVRDAMTEWKFRTEQPMPSEFPWISSSSEPQFFPVTRPMDKEVPRRIEKRDFPPSLWSKTDVISQSFHLAEQIQDQDKVVDHESSLERQIDLDVANDGSERSYLDDIPQPEHGSFENEVIDLDDIKAQDEEKEIIHSLPLEGGDSIENLLPIDDATSPYEDEEDLMGTLLSEDQSSLYIETEAIVVDRESEGPTDQPHQDVAEEIQNAREKRIQSVFLHMLFTFARFGTQKLLSATSDAMLRAYNVSTSPARVLMLSHNRVVPFLDATREASVIVVSNAVRESFNMTHQATEDALVVASSLSNRTVVVTRDLSTRVKAASLAASNQTFQLTREVATDVRSLMSGIARRSLDASKLTTKGLKAAGSIASTQTSAAYRLASTTVKSTFSNVSSLRAQIQTQTSRRIRLISISATRKTIDGAHQVIKSLAVASTRLRDSSAESKKRLAALIESSSMKTRTFLFNQPQKLQTKTLGFVSTLQNVESYVTDRRLLAFDQDRVALRSAFMGARSVLKGGVTATTSSVNQSLHIIKEFLQAQQFQMKHSFVSNSKAIKSSLGTIKGISSSVKKKTREALSFKNERDSTLSFGERINATVVSVASKMSGRIQIVGRGAPMPSLSFGSRPMKEIKSSSKSERTFPGPRVFDGSLLSVSRNSKKKINSLRSAAIGIRNEMRSEVLTLTKDM